MRSVEFRWRFLLILGVVCSANTVAQTNHRVVVIPLSTDTPNIAFDPVAANSPSTRSYVADADIVLDSVTKLRWQRLDDNITRNWEQAWNYCRDLSLAGRNDWRLPSIGELQSIVDYGGLNPAIEFVAFPGTNAASYWTSATAAADSTSGWVVGFGSGTIGGSSKSINRFVRCVR